MDAGLYLTIDTSIDIGVGKIYNACENKNCVSSNFSASLTGALSCRFEGIVCIDTWFTPKSCAGLEITAEFGSLTLSGSYGCNQDGC
ncbi:MAG: hypothetical protein NTX52_04900, partial [Planctomycetota bacterium]|nr:hypothetical protein [Planctomycetota bacterium]